MNLKIGRHFAWLVLSALAVTSVNAQETTPPKMASEPLSPEESRKKIHVPAGFRVELAAAEPLLLDPVAFDWDERGRLWVVEMPETKLRQLARQMFTYARRAAGPHG